MKLDKLVMCVAPFSDVIFLGRAKSKSGEWKEKIDFTNQFYGCLTQLCVKKINQKNGDDFILTAEIEKGMTLEVTARVIKEEDETSSTPNI